MFMLYEIFIWNCFAKLLYFCMNVFFIGIIRNSYLTPARLVCLLPVFFSLPPKKWFHSLYKEKLLSRLRSMILTVTRFILKAFLGHCETAFNPGKLWRPLPVINSIIKIPSKAQIISLTKLVANRRRQIFIFKQWYVDHVLCECGYQ